MKDDPNRDQIREMAIQMIRAAPHGLRHSDLLRVLSAQLPDVAPRLIAMRLTTLRHYLPPGMSVEKRVYRLQ